MLLSLGEPEMHPEMLYVLGLSLLESIRIRTAMNTRFVGMAEGMTLNFALKPAICFTFNKGIISPLMIMELFLTGV